MRRRNSSPRAGGERPLEDQRTLYQFWFAVRGAILVGGPGSVESHRASDGVEHSEQAQEQNLHITSSENPAGFMAFRPAGI